LIVRILLFNNSHLPKIGGKEIVVHHLAQSYQALGHEVLLAGPGAWWRFRNFQADYRIQRWPRVPGIPSELAWQGLYAWQTRRFRCDVVHAHTTYPNGWVAAKVRGPGGYPIIVTPHGADIHKVPEIGFGHRLDPVLDRRIRWALQQADYVTAISRSVVDSLHDAGLEDERIVEIPNGVDVARFQRRPDLDVRAQLGIPPHVRLVVSVGNYHPRKGQEVLIKALAAASRRMPDLGLVIVGAGSAQLKPLIERLGLQDRVTLAGILPYPLPGNSDPDVLAALLQADSIYVSSSVGEGSEGLSLALLEAMAAGACIVASDVSGNRDVIIDNVNGRLVPSGSVETLADALVSLFGNDSDRRRLAGAGQGCVEQMSWRAIAARYIRLFETAIETRQTDPEQPCGLRWRK
jgi:glycosyltransferase involved in cell wall biosynthesis